MIELCAQKKRKWPWKKSAALFGTTMGDSVAVQWKEQRPQLPNNRQMAESRLLSTERNLKKKEFVGKEYQKTIKTYVEKG